MNRILAVLCVLVTMGAASVAAQGRMGMARPRPHAGWYRFARPYGRGYGAYRSYRMMMLRRYRFSPYWYRGSMRPGYRRFGPGYGWRGYRRGRRNAI